MKSIFTQVFVTFGVIFLILMLIGVYLFVTDPYGLKPLLFGVTVPAQNNSASNSNTQTGQDASGGFQLSNAQVQALISLGIDPSAVPSSISAEQEACFVGVLGEARVGEIKAGAVPNAFEFLKAKSCL